MCFTITFFQSNGTAMTSFERNKSLPASKNITDILKHILTGYEKLVRPDYSGPALVVGITSIIRVTNKIILYNILF